MLVLHLLCFFWPPLAAALFLGLYRERIKAKGEFFLFATLALFGISRLISTELIPILVGLLPKYANHVGNSIMSIHWSSQTIAAIGGWFAMVWLVKHFEHRRVWNSETKRWEWGEKIDAQTDSH